MSVARRVGLTLLVLAGAYLVLMTGLIGTPEFVILAALVFAALAAVWMLPRSRTHQ